MEAKYPNEHNICCGRIMAKGNAVKTEVVEADSIHTFKYNMLDPKRLLNLYIRKPELKPNPRKYNYI